MDAVSREVESMHPKNAVAAMNPTTMRKVRLRVGSRVIWYPVAGGVF